MARKCADCAISSSCRLVKIKYRGIQRRKWLCADCARRCVKIAVVAAPKTPAPAPSKPKPKPPKKPPKPKPKPKQPSVPRKWYKRKRNADGELLYLHWANTPDERAAAMRRRYPDACERCGVSAGQECITIRGGVAYKPHSGRRRVR